jgi:OmpA-OmpF porin, OOP family
VHLEKPGLQFATILSRNAACRLHLDCGLRRLRIATCAHQLTMSFSMRQISKRPTYALLVFSVFLAFATTLALAQDMPGSRDHPAVKRFAGSTIVGYDAREFEAVEFQSSTFKEFDSRARKRVYVQSPLTLEGKFTRIWYEAPGATSSTDVYRNYANDLKASGFTVIYDSLSDAQSRSPLNFLSTFTRDGVDFVKTTRSEYVFAAAQRTSVRTGTYQKNNVFVRLVVVDWPKDDSTYKAKQGGYVAVDVLETKSIEQKMQVVTASEMSNAIASTGKVAIYGIFFDTNKADVKPESKPSLDQIAAYLKNEPNTRLHVVGHTDNVGGFDGNMGLSKRRADAVVAALTREYGVASSRLTANGVAYLAPVSTNSNEEGRAKNRRVELVLQ